MKLTKRLHFSKTDSTQFQAAHFLDAGGIITGPVLISASEQSAGKGMKNHQWFSPIGCLMFSLLFSPSQFHIPLSQTPLLGLTAGLALWETFQKILPPEKMERLAIHWPNDLYCQLETGRWLKIAGILLEGHTSGMMIAGMGVNLLNSMRNAPSELANRLISLNDFFPDWPNAPALQNVLPPQNPDFPEPMERFLALLLEELEQKLHESASNPLINIVRKVEKHCVQCGTTITLETPQGIITGFCNGLADDGAILIDGRSFHSGALRI